MLDLDLPEEWTSSNESVDAATDDLWGNETGTSSVSEDDMTSNQAMSPLTSALVWGSILTFICFWCCCSIYREYQQQAERVEQEQTNPSNKKGGTPKDWNEHFAKSGCQMTVCAKEHIIATETDIEQPPDSGGTTELASEVDSHDNDEEGVGYLMIPPKQASNGSIPQVPNCCVICMDTYKDGEVVVWSKDTDCRHVFHRDCFVDYLVCHKGKDRPCPTCRRDFCDRPDQHQENSEKDMPVMAGVTER